MSSQVYRKYIDIINENSQPQVLDEGILDTLRPLAQKVMKMLGLDNVKQIANQVKQVTGGDFSLNRENALKVSKALGLDKAAQQPVSEDWGMAGNWQGKLIQMLHLGGIAGAAASATLGTFANPLLAAGFILLIIADTIWSTDKGSVGSMGRYGNKGLETGKGPTTM